MNVSDIKNIISSKIRDYGMPCRIVGSDGSITETSVVLNGVWRKTKSKFEKVPTKIGENAIEYFIAHFPCEIDITRFGIDDTFEIDTKKFYPVKCNAIYLAGETQYYSAVLKQIFGEDENVS